jgi:hypothetical protein
MYTPKLAVTVGHFVSSCACFLFFWPKIGRYLMSLGCPYYTKLFDSAGQALSTSVRLASESIDPSLSQGLRITEGLADEQPLRKYGNPLLLEDVQFYSIS